MPVADAMVFDWRVRMANSERPGRGAAGVAKPGVSPTPGPAYTQVSSHIRDRHWSSGIAWPVYRGQK
ncbi:hypothetical protein HEK131_05620 [Streptomyces seoulensis]|nr:hypothetical protein HEK131_05620 [Streptomyces seoulensis]